MSGVRLHLFEGYGIELEYMIVDKKDFSVQSISDRLLHEVSGRYASEVEMGELNWSNELVLHVIELKTHGPAASLEPLPELFQHDVRKMNDLLSPLHAQLMPSAMHPWMDPLRQTRIWPHEYNAVYEAYNRIFNCQGHGWSNIQSMHINLPFANDSEFEKLHAAIRLVLPLIPALAASSPIVDGKLTGFQDNRLEFYRRNQKKIPSLVGQVVPEPLYTKKEYQDHLLKKLYQDVAPFDATRVLAHEWVNSRGAIARFDRSTIEIRLIDMQECPLADLSIAAAIISLIRLMIQETWSSMNAQKQFSTEILSSLLLKTVQDADSATLDDPSYLSLFGISGAKAMTAGQFWQHLIDTVLRDTIPGRFHRPLEIINNKGPLARRIIRSLDHRFTPNDLHRVYGQLIDCLHSGTLLG